MPPTTNQPSAPAEIPETLDEFCVRLSLKDKRVHMIGAFHHSERRAGHARDTGSNFEARYVAFCNKLV